MVILNYDIIDQLYSIMIVYTHYENTFPYKCHRKYNFSTDLALSAFKYVKHSLVQIILQ